MHAFKRGDTQLLVATTVIEVGVDVPEATIMVIDNAERLGLAQLHQLRGRVGRGAAESQCVLLYEPPLSETARARLDVMRQTHDGFAIAQRDLFVSYSKLAEVLEQMGKSDADANTLRIERWQEARTWYVRAAAQLDRMRERNILSPVDAKHADEVAGNPARCDAAISELTAATQPTTSPAPAAQLPATNPK